MISECVRLDLFRRLTTAVQLAYVARRFRPQVRKLCGELSFRQMERSALVWFVDCTRQTKLERSHLDFKGNELTSELTHFDDSGASRMVDVGAKAVTIRLAVARGQVSMQPETMKLITNRQVAKGDVFEVARLAGIMATKRTSELIPLCHSLGLDSVKIDFKSSSDTTVEIEATVGVQGRTGVEMEALTAVSVAALTIYDMCKAVDRGMTIGPIYLQEKSGGKSGHYQRPEAEQTT